MTDSTAPTSEAEFNQQVQKNLPRNFGVLLAHGLLGQTGFRLINTPTFVPAFILLLSNGSNFIVGLVQALMAFGMCLTPLLGATLIEHRKKVLGMGFITGAGMRLMVLGVAVSGYFLSGNWALAGVIFFLVMFSSLNGMQAVMFNFLVSKVVPAKRRGRLTGLRNFMAGVITLGVVYVGGQIIGDKPDAAGFSQVFLLAFILTALGLLLLLFMREPEPPQVKTKDSFFNRLAHIPRLMRSDQAYSRYVWARCLATCGRMGLPFYALYAIQDLGFSGDVLAQLSLAHTLAATISNLAWGYLSDRFGFRSSFLGSLLLWVAATLLLLHTSGLWLTLLAFCGLGASFQGFMNSAQNLTLEFGSRDDLPMRIALANSSSELAGAIALLAGGIISHFYGYELVFYISSGFLTVSAVVIWLWVPEPRQLASALSR